jgi:nicotinamidase/pyrazinamidase
MQVFLDVDVQNDFCEPSGALYVKGSPNDRFRAIVRAARERGAPILGSVDSHAFDAWEFASSKRTGPNGEAPGFPDHCVKGTWGWLKVDGTLTSRFRFVPNHPGIDAAALAAEIVSGEAEALYFEKEVYSLFANPNAEAVLREIAKAKGEPLEVFVFGVATDYCVKAAALGLRERGIATTVLTDAIEGITPEGTREAIEQMKKAGVIFATTSEIGVG